MDKNTMKCAFCDWKTTVWGKYSKPSKAYNRLLNHIEDKHPEKYKDIDIQALLGRPEENPEGETVGEFIKRFNDEHNRKG